MNADKAPDGTYSATKIIPGVSSSRKGIYSTTLPVSSGWQVFSTYAKAAGYDTLLLSQIFGSNSSGYGYKFRLDNGTYTQVTTPSVSTLVYMEDVGDGWYRCSVAFDNTNSTNHANIFVGDSTAINSYDPFWRAVTGSGNASSGILIWGTQYEVGQFPTSYIPSDIRFTSRSSVATYHDETGVLRKSPANSPRYGYKYDGRKWVETGLILENAATNRYSSSTGHDTIHNVTGAGTVITNNYSTAPDGSNTALRFQYTSAGYGYRYWPNVHGNGVKHTHSFYVKPVSGNTHVRHMVGGTPGSASWLLDFDNQTTSQNGGNGTTYGYTYEKLADGWWRVSISFSLPNSTGYVEVQWAGTNNPTDYYLWGMQVEDGLEVSSFIQSINSATTRSADVSSSTAYTRESEVARIHDISWYNNAESTIYGEGTSISGDANVGSSPCLWGITDGTSSNRYLLRRNASGGSVANDRSGYTFRVVTPGFNNDYFPLYSVLPLWQDAEIHKMALSIKPNSQIAAADGIDAQMTSITMPEMDKVTMVEIGFAGSSTFWNGHIRKLSYYPEQLTLAELKALTEND